MTEGSITIGIREATEEDNDSLIELQKRCPQGTSLVLGIDSSPDYFTRSEPFEDWHVFVATENDVIIGSAACTIRDTFVEARPLKTAYEYGFIVDPLHRRRGIAIKLQHHIENVALERNVDLLHLDVTENNLPSITLFSKMGFQKVKDCTILSLMAYRALKVSKGTNIRSMQSGDAEQVACLINEMYRNYSFFTPFQAGDFLSYVGRMPYFNLHNIVLCEDNRGLQASIGCWNYNKVRKYVVQKFNGRLKAQMLFARLAGLFTETPKMPQPGEPLLSFNLATLACRNPQSLTELAKHVVNLALDEGIHFLHVPLDPENPIAPVLSRFRHTRMKLHFFIKSLKREEFPNLGEKRLYIDVSEI